MGPERASSPGNGPSRRLLARLGRLSAGWVLLVVGLITAPTPLPIGLPLIALALGLLARDSERVRRAVRWVRGRVGALDRGLRRIEPKLPRPVVWVLHATDPHVPVLGSSSPKPAPVSSV